MKRPFRWCYPFIASIALVLASESLLAPCRAADPPAPAADAPALTPDQWRQDLDELVRELPKRHKNLFFKITREEFESRAAAVGEKLPSLDAPASVIEFRRLVAAVGDAHTTLDAGAFGRSFHIYPLGITAFSDGFMVTSAAGTARQWLGWQVESICGVPIGDAAERVAATYPWENQATKLLRLSDQLSMAEVLHAIGVCPSRERALYSFRSPAGEVVSAELASAPLGSMKFEASPIGPVGSASLSKARRPEWYWFADVPTTRMVYARYDRCTDQKDKPVEAFARELDARLDKGDVERLIVDLRNNSGGNSALLDPWIERLSRRGEFKRRGTIVVLTGRATFSSAQLNAASLRQKCGAIVIGQPTGQKPNAYGEIRKFTLMNSKMDVWYSTKLFHTDDADPESMMPDVDVPLTIADYLAGRDAAMEQAVAWTP